jgi:proline dehydrogenase
VALLDRAIVRLLPAVPKPVVRRISSRYIAGTELADACRVVRELNAQGKTATVDVLGEEITSRDEADAIAREYVEALETFERQGLNANVSVKLTGLGLELDSDFCKQNVVAILDAAVAASKRFVRIDMEDSTTTDRTLQMYRELRVAGYDNVGPVLQARLRRTLDDIQALADLRPRVRLCKGIYVEPAEIAYTDYEEIRAAFVRALDALFEVSPYPAIATHDTYLIDHAKRLIAEHGRAQDEYEFQMLLGVRENLAEALVREGHRLRVYVPFGEKWYEYSLRRLQENPKIAGYVAADTLGRFLPRRNGVV